MKKVSYQIIGRFENGGKYGIITKKTVSGFAGDPLPAGFAVKTTGRGCWTVDFMPAGLMVCEDTSRTKVLDKFAGMIDRVNALLSDEKRRAQYMEAFENAETEEEVSSWVHITFTTISDHKLDRVTEAAKNAGLLVKSNNRNSYITGGEVDIYGRPEKMQEVKEMIEKYNDFNNVKEEKEMDENKAADAQEVKQPEEVKEEVKTEAQDPEEIKADIMEEVKAGNLKVLLPMFMMNHKNTSAIMAAGISADAFSVAEVLRFLETGKMPDFHTFNVWQQLGYTVRKGEKAAFSARIWKYTEKEETEEAEADAQEVPENSADYIRKTAYFFGPAQVDAKPYKEFHAEGVKIEIRGRYEIATGKTKENKEALKTAGFTWNKKYSVWFRIKPETDGPDDPKGSPEPVREPETEKEPAQVIEESREPEKVEETAAETLERVYAEARERIQAADLTEAQRERLLLDIGNCHILGSAAAYMLETVKNADGLVYDVNGKAAMIRGEVKSHGWRNEKTAASEGEFWRAYVTEQYGFKEIRIYLKGDNNKELNIRILPKEEPNKKPRIDAEQVAEGMKNAVIEQATRIENAGIFAGRVKDLEEKKKAVLAMIAEMKKESIADYDTVSAFGFKEGNYSPFERARI